MTSPQPIFLTFAEIWQQADEQGRFELEERAGIAEYEGDLSRTDSEALAVKSFQRQCEIGALAWE
jgi:hypothetical protein